MRSPSFSYRLTFLPPSEAVRRRLTIPDPPPPGCEVGIAKSSLVSIRGPSRQVVFDHAAAILRIACAGMPPQSIVSRLEMELEAEREQRRFCRDWLMACGDRWTIIVGADVAFSPTGIDPTFPREIIPA